MQAQRLNIRQPNIMTDPPNVHVRPLQVHDIPLITAYWNRASDADLLAMGIDLDDIAVLADLPERLRAQLGRAPSERDIEVLVALAGEEALGHCYVNAIRYGRDACLHLHIWPFSARRRGLGTRMVAAALPHFFATLELEYLVCEPAAVNPGPNRILEKLGFEFQRCYETIPAGWNFVLEVNRWVLTRAQLELPDPAGVP